MFGPKLANLPFNPPMTVLCQSLMCSSSTFIDVFLASQLPTNLISVGQLVDNNYTVNIYGDGCVVQD